MDLNTLFSDAIAGDSKAIAELGMVADNPSEYNDGRTILHVACISGNTEWVQFILTEFADKNLLVKEDIFKQNALYLAAASEQTKVVEILVDAARRDLLSSPTDHPHNSPDSFEKFLRQANIVGDTALYIAVAHGHDLATVKALVEADPNDRHIQNSKGYTPLYLAAESGYNDIVKTICQTCAAPSLDGPHGTTALHAAISRHHEAKETDKDVVMVLMEAAKRSSLLEDALHEKFEALFNRTDHKNQTLLSLAVLRNHLDVVELILKENPAYERVPASKNNDLKSSISIASREGYRDICKILCEKYEAGKSDRAGHIVLIDAIKGGDRELVYAMLEYDKDLATCQTSEKWTALHYAVSYRFNTIIPAIITAQGEFYSAPSGGNFETPLALAVSKGFTSTVILLLGLLPNRSCLDVDHKGQNILHIAVVQSNKLMIQSILTYCPKIRIFEILNCQDADGNNPLHLLISNGCFVPELINHERVWPARNNDNWTPYDMLYFQEEIIAEQVKIKRLLDETRDAQIQADQRQNFVRQADERQNFWYRNFWRINIKQTSNKFESSVPSNIRLLKDIEFKILTNEMMEREHDQMKEQVKPYRERTGVQIVVTALITTVTFTVGFTMPGGYHQSGELEEGLVLLSRKKAFQIFMISDALALALSITSLFIYFISSMYDDPHQVSKFDAASTGLNIVSVMAMILTFIAGIYVVLSDLPGLALTVCIICSTFFLSIIVLLIKLICDRKIRRKKKG